ncbi:ABC transporter permease [Egicoccus sp. AB-alg6-2]|uniref:ABC transporter permease n=1 Tax=Egicoccus sp. AB-alg6-2 TaxID=3242692 RepID=UPI00359DC17F
MDTLTTMRAHAPKYLVYAASLLVGAVAWEVVGHRTDPIFLVPLSDTLVRLWELTSSGVLPRALVASLQVFGLGLFFGVVVGAPAGLLLARIRFLREGAEGYVTAAYATPMVALIPFILAIFGFGFTPKVIVVFLFTVFPMIISVFEGARSVDEKFLEVARSFRASEREIWRDVVLPYTLPFAMTGLRLAIARGLVGMIAAEFFLAVAGLGELILVTSRRFDTGGVFASILVVCLLGVTFMAIGQRLEDRFAAWREVGR